MLLDFAGRSPEVAAGVYVAPTATVIGRVAIAPGSSVWFNTVLRGDMDRIEVGADTNVQDLTMVHVDYGVPAIIGSRVTIGHRCIIHGCIIEDECLIGMGSVLLNRVKVGTHSIVAAGSVLKEGFEVPAGTLVAGLPAQVKRELRPEELARFARTAADYAARARAYFAAGPGS